MEEGRILCLCFGEVDDAAFNFLFAFRRTLVASLSSFGSEFIWGITKLSVFGSLLHYAVNELSLMFPALETVLTTANGRE